MDKNTGDYLTVIDLDTVMPGSALYDYGDGVRSTCSTTPEDEQDLNKVELNDSVYVYYNGVKYKYKIFDKYDIEKTGKAKVINSKQDKYITLITCNQNRKNYQIVLVGKLVEELNY